MSQPLRRMCPLFLHLLGNILYEHFIGAFNQQRELIFDTRCHWWWGEVSTAEPGAQHVTTVRSSVKCKGVLLLQIKLLNSLLFLSRWRSLERCTSHLFLNFYFVCCTDREWRIIQIIHNRLYIYSYSSVLLIHPFLDHACVNIITPKHLNLKPQ